MISEAIEPAKNDEQVKEQVQAFWNAHPCGAKFVRYSVGSPEFFQAVEHYRYRVEPHIPAMAGFAQAQGKRVLEIGCGMGTDGAQFARSGADYTGVDLSNQSIALASRNFAWRGLSGAFCNTDAESLPFEDNSFDLVYSHGVLHHTPNTQAAIAEVHRVLKPGGRATIMLYHKNSLNYYVGIMGLRRLGALLLYLPGGAWLLHELTGETLERLEQHRTMLKRQGISYLSSQTWLNYNTDGAGNPLSQVFSAEEALRLFSRYSKAHTEVRFLNQGWVPVLGKLVPRWLDDKIGRSFGWHLYVVAEK